MKTPIRWFWRHKGYLVVGLFVASTVYGVMLAPWENRFTEANLDAAREEGREQGYRKGLREGIREGEQAKECQVVISSDKWWDPETEQWETRHIAVTTTLDDFYTDRTTGGEQMIGRIGNSGLAFGEWSLYVTDC